MITTWNVCCTKLIHLQRVKQIIQLENPHQYEWWEVLTIWEITLNGRTLKQQSSVRNLSSKVHKKLKKKQKSGGSVDRLERE